MLKALLLLLSVSVAQAGTEPAISSSAYLKLVRATTILSYQCMIEYQLHNTLSRENCLALTLSMVDYAKHDHALMLKNATGSDKRQIELFIALTTDNISALTIRKGSGTGCQ